MNKPTVLLARLAQALQPRGPILISLENILAAFSTGHHVVDRAGSLVSEGAGHGKISAASSQQVNSVFQGPTPETPS
jgi:hypothetical protein